MTTQEGGSDGTRDKILQAAVAEFRKQRQSLEASEEHKLRVLDLIKGAEKKLRDDLDQIMAKAKASERKVLSELFNELLKLSQAVNVLKEVGKGRPPGRSASPGDLGKLADDSHAYHERRTEVLSRLHQMELRITDLIGKSSGRAASLSRRHQVTVGLRDANDLPSRRSA